MKLLKIGSSPMCDIVLASEFVSAHHADITILDNGDVLLEDKNSTNGTFVGNKKLKPNTEVPIRRGDYVRFGDEDLVWARVPQAEKNTKYKMIVNIGSNYRNDIVVSNETVSRYHATLKIAKDGKVYIADNGSKNGTKVNGVKIQEKTRIRKGDNILCGEEDVTDLLQQYLQPAIPKWAWYITSIVGVAAVALLAYLLWPVSNPTPEQIKPTVVYVRAAYHFEATLEENPLSDSEEYQDLFTRVTRAVPYQATAFFVDKEGRMVTNRHIAMPWAEEYREEGLTNTLREEYQQWLLEELEVPSWQLFFEAGQVDAIRRLQKTEIGRALLASSSSFEQVQAKIKTIENSKILISGEIDYITVGYPKKNYTHEDEFQRCYVLAESGDKNIDLALLQLNSKLTPADIVNGKTKDGKPYFIFSPTDVVTKTIEPLKETYCKIGYPFGLAWGLDSDTHSLEPTAMETKCSKSPSKYTFELSSMENGGASGSPVFDKQGHLVGVVSSTFSGQAVTLAVHAKYIKKMYEEEVGL